MKLLDRRSTVERTPGSCRRERSSEETVPPGASDLAVREYQVLMNAMGSFYAVERARAGRRAEPRHRVRRVALLLAIALAHGLVIMLLLAHVRVAGPVRQPTTELIATLDTPIPDPVAGRPEDKTRSAAATPSPEPPRIALPTAAPALISSGGPLQLDAFGIAGGGCDVAARIGDAIEKDPQALRELAALPPEARTKADAVLLWDGAWMRDVQTLPGMAHGALRQAVERSVLQSPPACLSAAVAGPRFIPIAAGPATVMLVIGSGQWLWTDLLLADSPTSTACDGPVDNPCPRPGDLMALPSWLRF